MAIDPPKFQPGGAASAGDDPDEKVTGQFGLTGNSQPGLRSPDAIDRTGNVLQITTSANVQALPPEQMAVLQAQMSRAGLLPSTYRPTGTLDDDTKKALLELKRTSQSTGLSDLDTLRQMVEGRAQAAAGAYGADLSSGGSAAVDNSPARQVSKSITEPVLTDPITARAIVRDAMAARLGRAPDADEYHRFRKLLSNSESGQDVSTTVTTTRPGKTDNDSRSVSRTTHSDDTTDPSPQALADEFTRKGALGREANTHMVGTDYYDVVLNLMGGR